MQARISTPPQVVLQPREEVPESLVVAPGLVPATLIDAVTFRGEKL
jgi:hypothetical protein